MSEPLIQSGHYAQKQTGCQSRLIAFSHRGRFRTACRLVEPYAGSSLLDYGCGDGSFLAMVAERFPVAVGADIDAKQNEDCARRLAGLTNLSFAHTSEIARGAHDGRYGVVTCMETLEHVSETALPGVLNDLRRAMAPGGTLIISVPIEIGPTLPLKQIARRIAGWRRLGDYQWMEHYSLSEMTRMAFATHNTRIARPEYSGDHGSYHLHKGFNWRALRQRLREECVVHRTLFSPFGWSGGLISSQAWFICGVK